MTYDRTLPSIKLKFTGAETGTIRKNVEIYIDFLCPFCGKFFYNFADKLKDELDNGKINLTLYPLAWIDFFSNHQHYSVRSALASAIVQEEEPDKLWNFVCRLLTRGEQPHEATRYDNAQGSNEHIAKDAADVGISPEICDEILQVSAESVLGRQLLAEARVLRDNDLIPGTPGIYVDGELTETLE